MIVSPLGTGAFIGRAHELATLAERRRALAKRHGSIVLIGGPAGIGKSRLLGEFCRTIDGGRAPVLIRTECLEFGGATFGPIREIATAAIGKGTDELDAMAQDALERGAFFRTIEHLITTAARKRSIVVCVEDLHWADPATLDFLAYLAPRIGRDRITIVATYRDDEIALRPDLTVAFARITSGPNAHHIVLGPLAENEMRALLGSVGSDRPKPSAGVVRGIVARAAGNPFYAEELFKAALDGDPHDATLPLSIEAGVATRFASLGATERKVLSHAAVLGYRFDLELLSAILPLQRATIVGALRRARDRQLIVEESALRIAFKFRHALTHEAIAKQMLASEARPLHARVATLLEIAPEAERRIDEIAYHWWMAKDAPRAVVASEAAGDAALTLHAYDAAAVFYERALALAGGCDARSRLYSRAAQVASIQGDDAGAMDSYERALELELEAGRYGVASELVRRIAGRLVYMGRDSEGRAKLTAFLAAHRADISTVDALLVEGWPILIELGGGNVRAWRDRLRSSGANALAEGRDAWQLLLLEVNAHADLGDVVAWRDAVARIREDSATAATIDRAYTLSMIGMTATYAGLDRATARTALDEAHAFCELHGIASLRKYLQTCETFHAYLHGDVRGAQTAAHLALPDRDDRNQRFNVAVAGILVGLDLDDAELVALAEGDLEHSIVETGTPHSTALAATGVARRLTLLGRDEEARIVLENAVAGLETLLGAQMLLPFAARYVTSARGRERIAELLATIYDEDASGQATRAMVQAVFASRADSADRVELALLAAGRYDVLGWPLLQAQALELAGKTTLAREIYMRCGNLWQARRLTPAGERRPNVERARTSAADLNIRERQVAELVAAGLRNTEIAERLHLSVKTVETHLSRMYAKLGLRSRVQLAAHIANEDQAQV